MSLGIRTRALFTLWFAIFLIAGCAHQPGANSTFPFESQWSGRLALKAQSTPPQAFSADFELGGSAEAGQLAFYTPLGTTAAKLQWAPGTATLAAEGQIRQFDSVEALVQQATGAELPVQALFDWLRGTATPVPGWSVDLSALEQGRLMAQRDEPSLPGIELRIILQR